MREKQPNFLVFVTDQHRADWLGCYGHPVVRTPNIDAIAAGGTRFENFHVASPVCMPNRASLMTGRYPSVHGLRYNGCVLPLRANTFVDVLAAAGYHTAAIGKSHLQPFTGSMAFDQPDIEAGPIKEAWAEDAGNYLKEEPDQYKSEQISEFPTPYYGFQHVDMVTSHGDRCGGHYQQWFRQKAPNWKELQDDANELPHNYSCPQAFRTPIPEALYPTSFIRDKAKEYLIGRQQTDQPFFSFVSFPDPHHPFNPPGKYWGMYAPDAFEIGLPYERCAKPTPPLRYLHENYKLGKPPVTAQTAVMLEAEKLKQAMALTAGMITMVDDAIGSVIQTLKDTDQFDNTIICFTSDHGDYLGDYNLLFKGALPYRSITRVPFIWSDPRRKSVASSNALASTLDISSTILERALVEPYHGMQGKSLLPCLDGSDALRDALLVEYNDVTSRLGFERPARVRSLLTHDFRFTLYRDEDWGELFDLRNDPEESNNVWDDEAYRDVKSRLSLLLNHQQAHLMDESPRATRLA